MILGYKVIKVFKMRLISQSIILSVIPVPPSFFPSLRPLNHNINL
jgi:hypothetical protein